jgi:ABC-type multidrug transport system ATPase subunit
MVLVDDTLDSLRGRFTRHLELEVVEGSERVVGLLVSAGYRAESDGSRVRVVDISDYRREVPRLLSHLLSQGIQVYGAQVQEPSLEEIFLRLIGEPVMSDM